MRIKFQISQISIHSHASMTSDCLLPDWKYLQVNDCVGKHCVFVTIFTKEFSGIPFHKHLHCSTAALLTLLRESLLCRSCLESFLGISSLWSTLGFGDLFSLLSGSLWDSDCSLESGGACSLGAGAFFLPLLSFTESLLQDTFCTGRK